MLDLADRGGDPLARDHFAPGHFTASAFVLCPARADVMLIHHAKLDRWLQPGGHVEPGDADPAAAALREAVEETGLEETGLAPLGSGLFDVDIHTIPARRDEPEHLHFDLRFAFGARSRAHSRGAEVRDTRWIPLAALVRADGEAAMLRARDKLRALGRGSAGSDC
ncbi:MAG: NUDIX domain-containing protein [bacterium]|nr:NUDIX domain-containing protein [bacterium]